MDRIFRSKTTLYQKAHNKPKLLLPPQISTKIIELEMQLDEGNITKNLILQLIQQYTTAIEFFQEREDQRFILYQKKLHTYLQKPMINKILNGGQSDLVFKKEKAEEQLRKASTQNKVVAQKMMECSEKDANKQQKKIKEQIESQIENLQNRIERKRIRSQRTKLSASFSASTQPDIQLLTEFQQLKISQNKFVYQNL